MNAEEYACDGFLPQRLRRDICKVCFQPLRLHEAKKASPKTSPQMTPKGSQSQTVLRRERSKDSPQSQDSPPFSGSIRRRSYVFSAAVAERRKSSSYDASTPPLERSMSPAPTVYNPPPPGPSGNSPPKGNLSPNRSPLRSSPTAEPVLTTREGNNTAQEATNFSSNVGVEKIDSKQEDITAGGDIDSKQEDITAGGEIDSKQEDITAGGEIDSKQEDITAGGEIDSKREDIYDVSASWLAEKVDPRMEEEVAIPPKAPAKPEATAHNSHALRQQIVQLEDTTTTESISPISHVIAHEQKGNTQRDVDDQQEPTNQQPIEKPLRPPTPPGDGPRPPTPPGDRPGPPTPPVDGPRPPTPPGDRPRPPTPPGDRPRPPTPPGDGPRPPTPPGDGPRPPTPPGDGPRPPTPPVDGPRPPTPPGDRPRPPTPPGDRPRPPTPPGDGPRPPTPPGDGPRPPTPPGDVPKPPILPQWLLVENQFADNPHPHHRMNENRDQLLEQIRLGHSLKKVPTPGTVKPVQAAAFTVAMTEIRKGVSLREVPDPEENRKKTITLDTELKSFLMKIQKQNEENKAKDLSEKLEQYRQVFLDLGQQIRYLKTPRGFPHLHHIRHVVAEARTVIEQAQIPTDLLEKKFQWPSSLLFNLSQIVDQVTSYERKIAQMIEISEKHEEVPILSEDVQQFVKEFLSMNTDLQNMVEQGLQAVDVEVILTRAKEAIEILVDRLYVKAFISYQAKKDTPSRKYESRFKSTYILDLLRKCCSVSDQLFQRVGIPKHINYSDAQIKATELEKEITSSQSSDDMDVGIVRSGSYSRSNSRNLLPELKQVIQSCEMENLLKFLKTMSLDEFLKFECSMAIAAIEIKNISIIDTILGYRQEMTVDMGGKDSKSHDLDWLCETAVRGENAILEHLVSHWVMDVNCMNPETGNTPLHIVARKGDLSMMATLINLGANPLALNSIRRTPLQLLAIKCFPAAAPIHALEVKEPLFDLSVFVNNPTFSDVVLISEDGKRFHAHRLVLCAQSAVFKAMMASQVWGTNKRQEVKLADMDSKVVRILLEYLYTGSCHFTREDLNLGVELMAAADQFLLEPMRRQCEVILSKQIDHEVVVPLYYVGSCHSATLLLNAASHYLLVNYNKVEDPDHKALLDLLGYSDVSRTSKSTKSIKF